MTFLTDKQVEDLLEFETRDLPLHDGTHRPHHTMKLVWSSVDVLLDLGHELDELVQVAIEESELQSVTFGEAFDGVVAWLHREAKNTLRDHG